MLSIKASYHELKLAQKTKEAVEEYYRADALAEEIYMNVSNILYAKGNENPYVTDPAWFDELKSLEGIKDVLYYKDTLSYEVYISNYAVLEVELKLNNNKDFNERIQVTSWKMVVKEQNDYEDSIDLWEGVINE